MSVSWPDDYDINAPVTAEDRADFRRACETELGIPPQFISQIEMTAEYLFEASDTDSARNAFQELNRVCGDYFALIENRLPGLFAKLRKRAGLPIPGATDFEEEA